MSEEANFVAAFFAGSSYGSLDAPHLHHKEKIVSLLRALAAAKSRVDEKMVVYGRHGSYWPVISRGPTALSGLAVGQRGGTGYGDLSLREYLRRVSELQETPPKAERDAPILPQETGAVLPQQSGGADRKTAGEEIDDSVLCLLKRLGPGCFVFGGSVAAKDLKAYFTGAIPPRANAYTVDELQGTKLTIYQNGAQMIRKDDGTIMACTPGVPLRERARDEPGYYIAEDGHFDDNPSPLEVQFTTGLSRDAVAAVLPYLNGISRYPE